MLNDLTHVGPRGGFDGLAVRDVWHVDADQSYNVATHQSKNRLVVAVRTLDGEGELTFRDGTTLALPSATLVVFVYRDLARYRCSVDRWHFMWLECDGALLALPVSTVIDASVSAAERSELLECFELMRSANAERANLALLRLKLRFARIVADWRDQTPASRTAAQAVEAAIGRMRDDLSGAAMSTLADQVNYSPRQLRIVFRRATGLSPKQYYDRLRLEHAAGLLTGSALTCAQIADRLGYSSAFHLSRLFNRRYGVSPSRYRRA